MPHIDVNEKVSYLIHYIFDRKRAEKGVTELYMRVPMYRGGPSRDKRKASFHKGPIPSHQEDDERDKKRGYMYASEDDIIRWLELVLKNAHVTFGGEVFLQILGEPQGVSCGVQLANMYLFSYELNFLQRSGERWGERMPKGLAMFFVTARRFIDDIWSIILDGFDFEDVLYDARSEGGSDGFYPIKLMGPNGLELREPLKLHTEGIGLSTTCLDMRTTIVPGAGGRRGSRLQWGVYDKRDDMICFAEERTFPHMESMLSESVKRAVLVGEIHRYDRRTSTREELVSRTVKMAVRMIRHGYPRQWIWRGLASYRNLLPAKGSWGPISVEIKRKVEVEWRRSSTTK